MHNGKIFPNGTQIQFQPRPERDDDEEKYRGHRGEIVYYTGDGFYRIKWDLPNPNTQLFNLGTVFHPEDLTQEQQV